MSKKIIIINGPNLNLLGRREIDIYGNESFDSFFEKLVANSPDDLELHFFQSNHVGELIDKIHEVGFDYHGIILNPGGYSHTSVALADAIAAVSTPTIEVHISNIHARESYREKSYTGAKAKGCITGLGLKGYEAAIQYFQSIPQ